jgi:hypothetical protein
VVTLDTDKNGSVSFGEFVASLHSLRPGGQIDGIRAKAIERTRLKKRNSSSNLTQRKDIIEIMMPVFYLSSPPSHVTTADIRSPKSLGL